MPERHRTPRTRRWFALGLGALFYPPLLVWAAFVTLVRRRGWRFALTTASVAGNALFLAVVIIAYAVLHGSSDEEGCPVSAKGALPAGFVCKEQGPLYFARVAPGQPASSVLRGTVFVYLHACVVASFEFTDGGDNLTSAELYDAACRPCIELDPTTGATSYSVYDGWYTDPEYSVRDTDADGIPDVKIDWTNNTSFRRAEPIEWRTVNECTAVGGEQGVVVPQRSP